LKEFGEILIFEYTSDIDIIERMQVTFYTDPAKVKEKVEMARKIYEERRARARGLKEEDVEDFTAASSARALPPPTVVSSPHNGSPTAGPSTGSTAGRPPRWTPKAPSSRCPRARLSAS